MLAKLPRLGIPMILREIQPPKTRKADATICKPYSFSGMQKIVHVLRDKLGLPSTFTLDACRHRGMTELEEAELTDGQGRALSAHRTETSLCWVCQAHDGARFVCNSEASRALAVERYRNIYSEWAAERHSE